LFFVIYVFLLVLLVFAHGWSFDAHVFESTHTPPTVLLSPKVHKWKGEQHPKHEYADAVNKVESAYKAVHTTQI
jgi:hypothetical protein